MITFLITGVCSSCNSRFMAKRSPIGRSRAAHPCSHPEAPKGAIDEALWRYIFCIHGSVQRNWRSMGPSSALVRIPDLGVHHPKVQKVSGTFLIAIYFRVLGRVQHSPEGTLRHHCSLGGNLRARTTEGMSRHRRMLVGKLSHRTPGGTLRHHYIQGDKLHERNRSERKSEHF
jgi:hypothetical protein